MQILITNVASMNSYKLICLDLFYFFIYVFSLLVDCSRGSELRHSSAVVVPGLFLKILRLSLYLLFWSPANFLKTVIQIMF
jgi:hypothetical protein